MLWKKENCNTGGKLLTHEMIKEWENKHLSVDANIVSSSSSTSAFASTSIGTQGLPGAKSLTDRSSSRPKKRRGTIHGGKVGMDMDEDEAKDEQDEEDSFDNEEMSVAKGPLRHVSDVSTQSDGTDDDEVAVINAGNADGFATVRASNCAGVVSGRSNGIFRYLINSLRHTANMLEEHINGKSNITCDFFKSSKILLPYCGCDIEKGEDGDIKITSVTCTGEPRSDRASKCESCRKKQTTLARQLSPESIFSIDEESGEVSFDENINIIHLAKSPLTADQKSIICEPNSLSS